MSSRLGLLTTVLAAQFVIVCPAHARDLRDLPPASDVNIFPQGSFEDPGENTEFVEGFDIPNNQEFRVVTENGKSWLRIENTDISRSADSVHAYVTCDPRFVAFTVTLRMRATNLRMDGREGWHDARIAMSFEGAPGSIQIPELNRDSGWVTKTTVFRVPPGAKRLNIQPALFFATGVFEISDFTIRPHFASGASRMDGVATSVSVSTKRAPNPRGRGRDTFLLRSGDVVLVMGDATIEDGGILEVIRTRVTRKYPELANVKFVNEGQAGQSCAGGLQRLEDMYRRHRPSVVLVSFGVNDALAPVGSYEPALRDMLRRLAARPVAVTVATPPCLYAPGRPELLDYKGKLDRLADTARRLVISAGVMLADCHDAMRRHVESGGADYSWGDGIHPNTLGRTLMANAILEAWRFGSPADDPPIRP